MVARDQEGWSRVKSAPIRRNDEPTRRAA